MQHHAQGVSEAVKAAPPIAVTGTMLLGVPISEWVTILTFVYVVLQIIISLPKLYDVWTRWRVKWRSKKGS